VAGLFEERLSTLREQVRQSENAVAAFRKKNGLATTTDEKVTVSDQELTSLNEKLAVASSETADKRAKFDQAKQFMRGTGDPYTLLDVVRSPVIGQLRGQQAELMRREADLREVYGASYPSVKQIEAQRKAIDSAMASEKTRLVSTLKNDYEVALAHENALRATMAKLANPPGANDNVGVALRELERVNRANKALFENFLNQSKLTQEQPSFEIPDARVISPAMEPLQPFSPKTTIIVPIASLAGLVLGLGLAAVLENFGGGVSTPRARVASTPASAPLSVVARISSMEPAEWRAYDSALDKDEVEPNPHGGFGRGIAVLADKLERAGGQTARVLSFVPSRPGQGCSTLVHGLARAMARADKRVLVIDADGTGSARTLSAKFNLGGRFGLGEALRGGTPLGGAIVPRKTFSFLPRGQKRINPADAAMSGDFDRLLDKAKRHFDVILVDRAAISEAGEIASRRVHSGLLFLVTSANQFSDAWPGDTHDDRHAYDDRPAEPGFDGVILTRLSSAPGEAPMARAV
jgi:Mrp family chromosome partitioning ATPase